MNIMELGAMGELVGAIAVVVTLGYLARQIRLSATTAVFAANGNQLLHQVLASSTVGPDTLAVGRRLGPGRE